MKFSKFYIKVIITLTVVLLYGCTSFNASAVDVRYAERPGADYGLDPYGIYALNKDIVFLFGGVIESDIEIWGPYYSLLLRSDDGGKHWEEVMQPESGSKITEMGFLEDGRGWVFVSWITEGAGPASLYHTMDYGKSWELLSHIPFPGHDSATGDIYFLDRQHVQVKQLDERKDKGCCILESLDGGATWRDTDECSAFGLFECFSDHHRPTEVVAEDGSQWRFEWADNGELVVSRRLPAEDTWSIVSLIPHHITVATE